MQKLLAAFLAAASCASVAQAQQGRMEAESPAAPARSLEDAIAAAGGAAPALDVVRSGIDAADANRIVAGLRPNPVAQAQVENIAGTGPYRGVESAETTVGFTQTLELGGKRQARIGVADAQLLRAQLQAAITAADVRWQVTVLYIAAVAADRKVETARDQARLAQEGLRAANVRLQAGRASPLEQQRAEVAKVAALANVERQERLALAARSNLSRRVGGPNDAMLDRTMLDRLPAMASYGPQRPAMIDGTLAMAAADADLAITDAGIRVAQANRIPNLDVGPSLRRLSATNDVAAVFTVSLPIPLFNNGRAAVAQARAQRTQAEAQRKMTALDVEQAITDAQAEAENAAITARMASGPALAAAQEAARIARIGYREGKFGQIDLLDAERTLADTRIAAIDALAAYHNARAQLERLTAPAPQRGN
ncbi:outer membrane protein, cobalt-zinc-cadmium efflux system [Sphingobium sp. AP50]|uniref:TolC family protein n=1 Tax=Sphingobium sp. AP50 TaxID=1884369 RepID=UPI0008D8AF29|nr:TolC family protein [Sphingobium sp. AP50]SEJ90285.1 outer membrane protein, cobalt-zinc-cadmium efflux system [Sphingobium sp. AP50]